MDGISDQAGICARRVRQLVKIKYVGSATVRTVMQYRWDKANGYVCDVPAELAANLLTYPRPDFVLAEPKPEAAKAEVAKVLQPEKPRRASIFDAPTNSSCRHGRWRLEAASSQRRLKNG